MQNHATSGPQSGRHAFLRFAWPGRWSLRPLIWFILVALTIAIGGQTASSLWQERQQAIREAQISTRVVARLLDQQVGQIFDGLDLMVRSAVRERKLGERGGAVLTPDQLKAFMTELPQLRAIKVADAARGIVLSDSGLPAPRPVSRADIDVMAEQREAPDTNLYVGQPSRDEATGAWTVGIGRRVAASESDNDLLIIAHLDLGYLQRLLDAIDVGALGTVSLMRADTSRPGFTILVRKPFDIGNIGRALTSPALVAERARQGPVGSYEGGGIVDGVRRFVSYQVLSQAPLVVFVARGLDEVLAPWRRAAWRDSSLAAGTLVVLWLLGGLLIREARQRAEAEAEMRRKASVLEAVLDSMDQGLLVVDAAGYLPLHNRRLLELLDLPSALMTGSIHKSALAAFQRNRGEYADLSAEVIAGLQLEGAAGVIEPGRPQLIEQMRPDGTVLEMRTHALRGGGAVRTVTDLTDRKRAESALRESATFADALLDSSGDCVKLLDLEGRMLLMNESGRCLMEVVDYEACRGIDFLTLLPLESRPAVQAALDGARAGRRETLTVHCPTANGSSRWWDINASPVPGPSGQPVSLLVISRDVTARRAAEQAREEAVEAARAANRVKGEFLAAMSHEVRTPLNGILGASTLLLGSENLSGDHRKLLHLQHEAGRTLLAVVDDILDWSKIEEGRLTLEAVPLAPRELVETCLDIVRESAKLKAIELRADFAPSIPAHVRGDPTRLRQILLNLVSNAVKFTRRGLVTVSVEQDRAGRLLFRVKDPGIGIPKAKQDLLFRRFSQVDASTTREYGGSGLGLAICRSLVELMGGEIGVVSEEGLGSAFWFALDMPLVEEPSAPSRPPVAALVAGHARRILLADDVRFNQTIFLAFLGSEDHVVDVVENGAAAVEAARGGGYDLILMDVQMPVMDGHAAARAIRALEGAAGQVPILALTAGAFAADAERALASGMNGHLSKPIDRGALIEAVRQWTARPDDAPSTAPTLHEAADASSPGRPHAAPAPQAAATRQPAPARLASVLMVEDETIVMLNTLDLLEGAGLTVRTATTSEQALHLIEQEGGFDLLFTDVRLPGRMDGLELARCARRTRPDLSVLVTSGYTIELGSAGLEGARTLQKPYSAAQLITEIELLLGWRRETPRRAAA